MCPGLSEGSGLNLRHSLIISEHHEVPLAASPRLDSRTCLAGLGPVLSQFGFQNWLAVTREVISCERFNWNTVNRLVKILEHWLVA